MYTDPFMYMDPLKFRANLLGSFCAMLLMLTESQIDSQRRLSLHILLGGGK